MSAATEFARLFALMPEEAVQYLVGRHLLTQTFDWTELWQEEHAYQFTVSRLARLDLLQTIRDKVTASVQGDLSRRDFMKDVKAALAEAGWWGIKQVTDPNTGEIVTTKFDPSRLKLIYDTNTRMAYAAGQWQRIQRTTRTHPYLRYITKHDDRVRPAHAAWEGITLPVDDPFWQTHYPPNGFRCRCRVVAVNQRDYDRGVTPTGRPMIKTAPSQETKEWINKKTGEVVTLPVGIDPGFAYNPGVAADRAAERHKMVTDKLAAVDPGLAKAAKDAGFEPDGSKP